MSEILPTIVPQVSLIIPCYKEESHLEQNVLEIERVMEKTHYSYEFIFIEDCSPDNTPAVLKKIITNRPWARAVFHTSNIGRGGVVREGLLMARGMYAGFLDIDLEVAAHYIPAMLAALERGNEMVCANRIENFALDPNGITRLVLSRGYKWLAHFFLKLKTVDSEAGYKFFSMATMREVIEKTTYQHWFWDTEIVYRAEEAKKKVVSLPVVFMRQPEKKSTVKLLPDTISFFKSLLQFKREIKRSTDGRSRIYRSVWLYRLLMFILYQRTYWKRFNQLASFIASGSSVVELCAGPGDFFTTALRQKNIQYQGFELSPHFVQHAKKRGLNMVEADVANLELPVADYCVIISSLYHFYPHAEDLVHRMLKSARQGVLIMEPIKNISSSKNRVLSYCAGLFTNEGKSSNLFRFDEALLNAFINDNFKNNLVEKQFIANKREIIIFLKSEVSVGVSM